jgi:hypothetical protein
MRQVGLDGVDADEQRLCNLLVGGAVRRQLDHAPLGGGQLAVALWPPSAHAIEFGAQPPRPNPSSPARRTPDRLARATGALRPTSSAAARLARGSVATSPGRTAGRALHRRRPRPRACGPPLRSRQARAARRARRSASPSRAPRGAPALRRAPLSGPSPPRLPRARRARRALPRAREPLGRHRARRLLPASVLPHGAQALGRPAGAILTMLAGTMVPRGARARRQAGRES